MDPAWILTFPADWTVAAEAEGGLTLRGPGAPQALRRLSPGLREAFRRLAAPGERAGVLADLVLQAEGPADLPRWYFYLQELAQRQLLRLAVDAGGERLATLEPTASSFILPPGGARPDQPFVLSRFAWMQQRGGALSLESPLSPSRVVLHDPRATALVHALARPGTAEEVAGRGGGLGVDAVTALLGLLAHTGAICAVAADGTPSEDADPALRCWQFHDLLFHTRSRLGRHDAPAGAIFPQAGRLPPFPALRPDPDAECIDLPRPDLEQIQRQDPPFARVQECRRSVRQYATEPITDQQLGEFLYRVARVKERQQAEVQTPIGPVELEFAMRPYPSGGALYELEVYVAIQSCRGLAAGLYHYDGLAHRLVRRVGPKRAVDELLADAGHSTGLAVGDLQVLLILAARLPRLAWKYAGLAYALVLKHVGVVVQTMYLNATAMGLAPCAVGLGDSELFGRAAGLDYYAETSVGEVLLGSLPREG